jgi:tRNA G10  N-methylase Trm11
MMAEKHLGGDIRAAEPASIILVFTPDNVNWIAGFVTEKKDSIIDKLQNITERTCVSLTSQAALAMVNIVTDQPIIDPCCGTGLIPLASLLRKKETYTADNNYKMLRMARKNRDILNLDIEMPKKDAFNPWMQNGCLITDFPADRSWVSNTKDLSMELFKAWIPYIRSFCVIFPNRVLEQLPENIVITRSITFTADRTILLGTVNHN